MAARLGDGVNYSGALDVLEMLQFGFQLLGAGDRQRGLLHGDFRKVQWQRRCRPCRS